MVRQVAVSSRPIRSSLVDAQRELAAEDAVMSRPVRRLTQLLVGLWLYGTSMALLVRSRLGVMPWDVLHQGLARHLGWSLGTVVIATGAVVLLGCIPLRQ